MGGAGDVAGAAGAGAGAVDRLVHGGDHGGMLAHAEIVVGAPDRDVAAAAVIERAREGAGPPLQIGEHAIAALGLERVEPVLEKTFVIHHLDRPSQSAAGV